MGILGKSKKEAWQEFAQSINAEIIDMGVFKGGQKVKLHYKKWDIVMDTYSESSGHSSTTYTRVRAVYIEQKEFAFRVYKTNLITKIENYFGKQIAETGDPAFDETFTIRCDDTEAVKNIFSNQNLKEMICALNRPNLFVKKAKGKKETRNVVGESEIHYYMTDVVKDIETLTLIFGIFINLLDAFVENGIAIEEEPIISYIRN